MAKTVSSTTTRYHYDANGNLIGETTGSNHRDYAWLGDLPVAMLEGTSQYYIYADHLDTPRVVTNAANTIVWRWDSDPFGFFPAAEDPDGNSQLFTLNLRFPGQYFDKETNLHYNYFRDYDPQTGRYVKSDPIGLEGGINTYVYVLGNPLTRDDPLGLNSKPPICFGNDCPEPPMCPSRNGPRPCPQPEEGGKPRNKYDCHEVSTSHGACLICCSTRSPPNYIRRQGSSCQQMCNDTWGLTEGPAESLFCQTP